MSHKVFLQFTQVEPKDTNTFETALFEYNHKVESTNNSDLHDNFILILPNMTPDVGFDSLPTAFIRTRNVEYVDSFCPLFLDTLRGYVSEYARKNETLASGELYVITWRTTHLKHFKTKSAQLLLTDKSKKQLNDAIIKTFAEVWLTTHRY